MQRTTVRLPDDLLEEAKDFARQTDRTLTQLLEDAVRAELARGAPPVTMRVGERPMQYRVNLASRQQSGHEPPPADPARAALQVREHMNAQVADIQAFLRTLPDRDSRQPDEILGYDSHGLPG